MKQRNDTHTPEAWTPSERRALELWRAPEPPEAFVTTVVAASSAAPRFRGVAVAAAALLIVGGFFGARLLTGGHGSGRVLRPAALSPDGGARPEVAEPFDGFATHES